MDTYEKKYNEAQKWIESIYPELSHEQQMEAEAFFPELKESEDERLRKDVKRAISVALDYSYFDEETANNCLSWLEKQEGCECIKKDWLEHIKQSWYKEGFIDGKYSGEKQDKQKSIDDLTPQEAMDIAVAKCFEQGEQKPVDKVKPKFKVGDVMRTLQEAANNITSGLPVVVSIDEEYYHCTNELIAIKDQDDYEYPPMNRAIAWSEEDEKKIDTIIEIYHPVAQVLICLI